MSFLDLMKSPERQLRAPRCAAGLLGGDLALHPVLEPLAGMWLCRELVVPACGELAVPAHGGCSPGCCLLSGQAEPVPCLLAASAEPCAMVL